MMLLKEVIMAVSKQNKDMSGGILGYRLLLLLLLERLLPKPYMIILMEEKEGIDKFMENFDTWNDAINQ
jgi:hypothetical protein